MSQRCGYGVGVDGRPCGKPATVAFHKEDDPRHRQQMLWLACDEHEANVRAVLEREGLIPAPARSEEPGPR
jgi:hypothetical protein